MTNEEAIEIRDHLISELRQKGFTDVIDEIQTRLLEDNEGREFSRSQNELLSYFLSECIDLLRNRSNDNYQQLLKSLNQYNSGDIAIETIEVEYQDELNKSATFNLKDLPSYDLIITGLQEILEEVRNEG
jgi:hypothetical protein